MMRYMILIALLLCLPVRGEAWQVVGGGDEPTAIQFAGENTRWQTSASSHGSYVITVASTIPAGSRAVIINKSPGVATNTVSDSAGNSWSIDWEGTIDTRQASISSSVLSTQLSAGAQITITYDNNTYRNETGILLHITGGVGGVGIMASNSGYGTAISAPGTTTVAPAVNIGIVSTRGAATYSSSLWSVIGAQALDTTYPLYYLYKEQTTSGVDNPGGVISQTTNWAVRWISYY